MLDNSVIFGYEKLTTGLPAFVNCTAQTLTEDQVLVLPPKLTILEILEEPESLSRRSGRIAAWPFGIDDLGRRLQSLEPSQP